MSERSQRERKEEWEPQGEEDRDEEGVRERNRGISVGSL